MPKWCIHVWKRSAIIIFFLQPWVWKCCSLVLSRPWSQFFTIMDLPTVKTFLSFRFKFYRGGRGGGRGGYQQRNNNRGGRPDSASYHRDYEGSRTSEVRSLVEGERYTSIYWLYNRAKRNFYSGLSLGRVALKFCLFWSCLTHSLLFSWYSQFPLVLISLRPILKQDQGIIPFAAHT